VWLRLRLVPFCTIIRLVRIPTCASGRSGRARHRRHIAGVVERASQSRASSASSRTGAGPPGPRTPPCRVSQLEIADQHAVRSARSPPPPAAAPDPARPAPVTAVASGPELVVPTVETTDTYRLVMRNASSIAAPHLCSSSTCTCTCNCELCADFTTLVFVFVNTKVTAACTRHRSLHTCNCKQRVHLLAWSRVLCDQSSCSNTNAGLQRNSSNPHLAAWHAPLKTARCLG
jgi:hypothetical protein